MTMRESEIRRVVRRILAESSESEKTRKEKPVPVEKKMAEADGEMRKDRITKREMMHRIFMLAKDNGSRIPLLMAIQAVGESLWGEKTVMPNNVLNIKDPKKIAAYGKLPKETRKKSMQYRSFSSLEDCIKYYIDNIEPRVLGIQMEYEKEKGIPAPNTQTDPASATISSLFDNLKLIKYAENPSYKEEMRKVVAGPTAVVNIDLPHDTAASEYRKRYQKEIEAVGKKYGYVSR
jgi:hypothetical protein